MFGERLHGGFGEVAVEEGPLINITEALLFI